jgi:hypothetical protein
VRKLEPSRAIPIAVATARDVTETDRQRRNPSVVGLVREDGLDRDSPVALIQPELAGPGGNSLWPLGLHEMVSQFITIEISATPCAGLRGDWG